MGGQSLARRTDSLTARLAVRLTPSGGADRIDGRAAGADGAMMLKARVRAAAENNEANRALEALIAKCFGIAKSRVRVVRGHTARLKQVAIEGVSEADVAKVLSRYEGS